MKYIGSLQYDDALLVSKQIVLCGSGQMIDAFINELSELNIINKVVAICDSDETKQGIKINNIKIMSYDEAVEKYPNADYVVYNKYKKDIAEKLILYTDKLHYIYMQK